MRGYSLSWRGDRGRGRPGAHAGRACAPSGPARRAGRLGPGARAGESASDGGTAQGASGASKAGQASKAGSKECLGRCRGWAWAAAGAAGQGRGWRAWRRGGTRSLGATLRGQWGWRRAPFMGGGGGAQGLRPRAAGPAGGGGSRGGCGGGPRVLGRRARGHVAEGRKSLLEHGRRQGTAGRAPRGAAAPPPGGCWTHQGAWALSGLRGGCSTARRGGGAWCKLRRPAGTAAAPAPAGPRKGRGGEARGRAAAAGRRPRRPHSPRSGPQGRPGHGALGARVDSSDLVKLVFWARGSLSSDTRTRRMPGARRTNGRPDWAAWGGAQPEVAQSKTRPRLGGAGGAGRAWGNRRRAGRGHFIGPRRAAGSGPRAGRLGLTGGDDETACGGPAPPRGPGAPGAGARAGLGRGRWVAGTSNGGRAGARRRRAGRRRGPRAAAPAGEAKAAAGGGRGPGCAVGGAVQWGALLRARCVVQGVWVCGCVRGWWPRQGCAPPAMAKAGAGRGPARGRARAGGPRRAGRPQGAAASAARGARNGPGVQSLR
jgi:hypothetical protein